MQGEKRCNWNTLNLGFEYGKTIRNFFLGLGKHKQVEGTIRLAKRILDLVGLVASKGISQLLNLVEHRN